MAGLVYPKFFPILQDKVTIVTGAAQGMGEATAKLFAAAGAKVLCVDFNDAEGEKTVQEIRENGGEASYLHVDISNEEEVINMVNTAVERYGRLDGAVNNAAKAQNYVPFWEFDSNFWDEIHKVNVKGTALCMKYETLQMMKQGNGGSIVNVSSINSVRPKDLSVSYTSSKHAVLGLTKVASMEAGKYGIRISCLAPGAINTPMLRSNLAKKGVGLEAVAGMSRLGRHGEPEEIAMGNLFLISDMSSYVTGTTLFVDGGHSAL